MVKRIGQIWLSKNTTKYHLRSTDDGDNPVVDHLIIIEFLFIHKWWTIILFCWFWIWYSLFQIILISSSLSGDVVNYQNWTSGSLYSLDSLFRFNYVFLLSFALFIPSKQVTVYKSHILIILISVFLNHIYKFNSTVLRLTKTLILLW